MANPYDVPSEMRDFADRSVTQARKAFDTFMGAIRKTTDSVEGPGPAAHVAKDVAGKAVNFAENNVSAAFDLAEKLVHAKDIQEVMKLQSDYLRQQFDTLQTQMKELGDVVQKATGTKTGPSA